MKKPELPCKKCKGKCCGPLPVDFNEFAMILKVNKLTTDSIKVTPIGGGKVMVQNKIYLQDCPFLNPNGRCGIYNTRPQICRDFGMIEALPCPMVDTTFSGNVALIKEV